MALQAPITRRTHRALREVVLEHTLAERRRRRFPPAVHVRLPSGGSTVHVEEPGDPTDHGVRTDVAAALLLRARDDAKPLVWLTRPGTLEPHDVDAGWASAVGAALAEAGRDSIFVVVTRNGWRDPVSGVRHEWKRLRPRSGRA